ncbi:MAG: zf-HC2 domain-containing protein, partial [Planctomycetota bacterium]
MNHRELLHAYFDGELSGEEAARFERALAADP